MTSIIRWFESAVPTCAPWRAGLFTSATGSPKASAMSRILRAPVMLAPCTAIWTVHGFVDQQWHGPAGDGQVLLCRKRRVLPGQVNITKRSAPQPCVWWTSGPMRLRRRGLSRPPDRQPRCQPRRKHAQERRGDGNARRGRHRRTWSPATHSLVAPAVKPLTRKRCENKKTISTGATEMSVASANWGSVISLEATVVGLNCWTFAINSTRPT